MIRSSATSAGRTGVQSARPPHRYGGPSKNLDDNSFLWLGRLETLEHLDATRARSSWICRYLRTQNEFKFGTSFWSFQVEMDQEKKEALTWPSITRSPNSPRTGFHQNFSKFYEVSPGINGIYRILSFSPRFLSDVRPRFVPGCFFVLPLVWKCRALPSEWSDLVANVDMHPRRQ